MLFLRRRNKMETLKDFVGQELKTKGGQSRWIVAVNPRVSDDESGRIIAVTDSGGIRTHHINGRYRAHEADINDIIIPQPFGITEIGLYKTRDGRRAFVGTIMEKAEYPAKGFICGETGAYSWFLDGRLRRCGVNDAEDLVAKWDDK
jgi:hypothetical protein